jgi:hypothetical protein
LYSGIRKLDLRNSPSEDQRTFLIKPRITVTAGNLILVLKYILCYQISFTSLRLRFEADIAEENVFATLYAVYVRNSE